MVAGFIGLAFMLMLVTFFLSLKEIYETHWSEQEQEMHHSIAEMFITQLESERVLLDSQLDFIIQNKSLQEHFLNRDRTSGGQSGDVCSVA